MTGRRLLSNEEAIQRGFKGSDFARRREILGETIAALKQANRYNYFHCLANENLERWRTTAETAKTALSLDVVSGDWGEVTYSLTRKYGKCFAVLNMANAYVPGGHYVEGTVAQEENMFRRTDCHFRINEAEYNSQLDKYYPEMTALLSAEKERVYLDTQNPRVCIRGPEDRKHKELGYHWLSEDKIFPFYELRAAALDLRDGSSFNPVEIRKRICAQLDTLRDQGIRHTVLGAFGCGAFRSPADQVALLYQKEIEARSDDFNVIVFAVFSAGYGPDNFTPFSKVFQSH